MFLHKPFCLVGLAFILAFIIQQSASLTVEAQDSPWTTPQKILGYNAEANPPILIADQNRMVHAFFSQRIDEEDTASARAIFYNQWTFERGWTSPTDIIVSPYKEARVTDAYLDNEGVFHVVFYGGDNMGADIYYSTAPAATADDARAWSLPVVIGRNAGDPEGAVLFQDDGGNMNVIYNGREIGNALYLVHSTDAGESWSDPAPIFFTRQDEPFISQLHILKGKSGWFHAIWAVFSAEGQGRGIYYARSKDGLDWNEPILLSGAQEGLGTSQPMIFEYHDTLMAFYHQGILINLRLSGDNGNTWGDPSRIFSRHSGGNGAPSLVVDANDDLHLFVGQRISGNPDIHGMWQSIYQNNRWLEPSAIVKGPLVQDSVEQRGFDPVSARAIVSQGNIILVTWSTDPNAGRNGVWFSYKRVDAPELPILDFPPSENPMSNPETVNGTSIINTAVSTASTASIMENYPVDQVPTDRPNLQIKSSLAITIGFIAGLMLLLIVVVVYRK